MEGQDTLGAPDKMTSEDSQSSQARWTEEIKKEPLWKDRTRAFHEAGTTHERKGSCVAHEPQRKPKTERSTC